MQGDFKKSQLHAIQYWTIDGTFEFGFGLLCVLLAGYFYAETHVSGWLSAVVDVSLVLVIFGSGYLVKLLIRKLKEGITWPRTGYVAYKRKPGIKRGWRVALGFVAGVTIALVISMLVMNQNIKIAVMPLLSGLLFGLVMCIVGRRTAVPRFYLLALLSAVIGAALAFSGIGNYSGLVVYYAAIAVILLFTGTWVLRAYLRQNPLPPGEDIE